MADTKKGMGSIGQHACRWVRDDAGTAHAVRQSEQDHHAGFCGKYVFGRAFRKTAYKHLGGKCPECCRRVEHPTVPPVEGRSPARAVLMGRGVQAELGRQRKGRKRGGEQ